MTNRKLVWEDNSVHSLDDVVAVLNVLNPKGYTAAQIKAHVQLEFDNGLDSYVGTAGWYVTVYRAPSQPDPDVEIWNAIPTIMAYSVLRYLKEQERNDFC